MAKQAVFRIWLDCKRRTRGAPDLFVDVPIQSSGNAKQDEKNALNLLRAVIRNGVPAVVAPEPPAPAVQRAGLHRVRVQNDE